MEPRSEGISADAYDEVLAQHTRRQHLYHFLEDRIDVRATYHSAAFKQAFAAARPRFQGRAAEHIETILQGRLRPRDPIKEFADVVAPFAAEPRPKIDTRTAQTFFVALYVADQNNRSLIHDSSIWDVSLSVDGGPEIKPLDIENLRRTPSLDQIYPYLGKLDVPYILYFAPTDAEGKPLLGDQASTMTLRIVSKLADAKLTWDFQK